MEYPLAVRARFERPLQLAGHGDASPLSAEVGRADRGAAVALLVWPDAAGTRAASVRFRAFGCPYLVAAADLACERLRGAGPAAFEAFDALALGTALGVPDERNGRLLLIADAAAAIARRWQGLDTAHHAA